MGFTVIMHALNCNVIDNWDVGMQNFKLIEFLKVFKNKILRLLHTYPYTYTQTMLT